MKEQILSPGVQDRREADLGAEPLGIGRQRQEAVPNHSQRGFQEEFLHHSAAFSSMTRLSYAGRVAAPAGAPRRPRAVDVSVPQWDEARRAGLVGEAGGVDGHQARAFRRAKRPRSTFTKRDSAPLVVSSLSIEVYNVADGVLPPGDVQ